MTRYQFSDQLTVIQAEQPLCDRDLMRVVLPLRQAYLTLYQQTNGLVAQPDTLWLPPYHHHYLSITPASTNLYHCSMLRYLLDNTPCIRKIEVQPTLIDMGRQGQPIAVLFNARAVAKPECLGWLVGGAPLYRPSEVVVIEGV